ncbi:MAG: TonB-dependent receptor [Gammaproteobacteria bacterium]|nr:TonB-dependent receptor [Gammaproteobacteria bacterium]
MLNTIINRLKKIFVLGLLPMFMVCSLNAAEPDTSARAEGTIEEIVVTATKRAENLQDVPITINVLSGDDIALRGLENGDDLARSIPGMIKTGQGRELDSSFLIRGIGTGSNPGTDLTRPTSVYLDDVPITSNNAGTQPDFRLFDIDRVEVLKGPQGTLFGAGTLSGVVRVIANKADPSAFDWSLGSEFASTSGSFRHRYNAMVNIPFNDRLALRIAASIRDEDGYMKNIGANYLRANGDPYDLFAPEKENSNANKDEGVRASLFWDVNDNFNATVNYLYQNMDTEDFDVFDPERGRLITGSWLAHGIESVFENYNLTLSYDFGFATLTSSTNSYEFTSETVIDLNQIIFNNVWAWPWAMHRTDQHENFVQELRLVSSGESRFNYVVGYFNRESDNDFDWIHFTAPQFAEDRNLVGLQDRSDRTWEGFSDGIVTAWSNTPSRQNNDTDEAFFIEVTFDITDTVTVALGARSGEVSLTDRRVPQGGVEGSSFGSMIATGVAWQTDMTSDQVLSIVQNTETYEHESEDVNTLKFSVMWKATDEINLFALASEGFRGSVANPGALRNGGVSLSDPTDVVIPPKSNGDGLWNYEVGMKSVFLDGALSANVSLFQIDWEGFQFFARRRSDAAGFTTNVGKAVSRGLEAEFVYLPNANLDLGLNFSIIKAEIDQISEVESFMTGGSVGDRLQSPEFSAVAFAQYSAPSTLLNGYEWFIRGDIQHVGDVPNSFPNVAGGGGISPNATYALTDTYQNVNFSIGVSNENWRATFFVENLLDDDGSIAIDQNNTFEFSHRGLIPRTLGVRLSYRAL